MDTNFDNHIMTLNPSELIKWCRERKKELGLSNAAIAEKTAVPIGTIDRVFSGNYSEFKYSSIQPVIAFLIGIQKDTPQPQDSDSEQEQYYYNTIEGYKLIVKNKNYEIGQLKVTIETKQKELDFLKEENAAKSKRIDKLQEIIDKMQGTIDRLTQK